MRRQKILALAAGTTAMMLMASSAKAVTTYQWQPTAAATYSWTNTANWVPNTGFPVGAPLAGDVANLSVNAAGNQNISLPSASGPFYLGGLTMGSTGATPITTDLGNANSGNGALAFDNGINPFNVSFNPTSTSNCATIVSQGAFGSSNVISAPILLVNPLYITGGATGGTNGVNGLTNNVPLTISGNITNSGAGATNLSGAGNQLECNVTNNGLLGGLIITGNIALSEATAPAARTLSIILNNTTPSNNNNLSGVISGVISDGGQSSNLVLSAKSGAQLTISGTNTYTGYTNLSGNINVLNNQAFGTGRVFDGTTTPVLNFSDAPHTLANDFYITSSTGMTLTGNQPVTFNGSIGTSKLLINNSTALVTFSGKLWAPDTKQVGFGGTGNVLVSTPITDDQYTTFQPKNSFLGAGGVNRGSAATNLNSGTTFLNAANPFSGNMTVTNGAIRLGNALAASYSANQIQIQNQLGAEGGIVDLNGLTVVGKGVFMGTANAGANNFNGGITNISNTPATLASGATFTVAGGGTGLSSIPTVTVNNSGTNGTGASVTINGMSIGSIAVASSPTDYMSVPTVTISGGGGGTATGIASLKIASVAVGSGGSGFIVPPAVDFVNGGGSAGQSNVAPTGTAVMRANQTSVTNAGSGYTPNSTVAVTVSGGTPTTAATAHANIDSSGFVSSVVFDTFGSGYQTRPTLTIAPPTSGTTATATATDLAVASVNMTQFGSYLTTAPQINFRPPLASPGGSGASATAALSVAGVFYTTDNAFTSVPTVTISGGGSAGAATATATLSLNEAAITVNSGTGYTSAPAVALVGSVGTATVTSAFGSLNFSVPVTLSAGTGNIGGPGDISVNEQITGSGAMTKVGADTVNINTTAIANTFNGTVIAGGGVLKYDSSPTYSAITAGTINVIAGGAIAQTTPGTIDTSAGGLLSKLKSTSVGALALTGSVADNLPLDFTVAPLSNLTGMSVGAVAGGVTYTNTITPAVAVGYRLGGGGTLTLSNTNALTSTNNAAIVNGGTVALTSTNNYSGTTTIQGNYIADYTSTLANGNASGTIALVATYVNPVLSASFLDDSASSIGTSTPGTASNLVINGGTLKYVGTAVTSTRLFTIGATGATLNASGTGALNLSNTGAIVSADVPTSPAITIPSGSLSTTVALVTGLSDTSNLAVGMTVADQTTPGNLSSPTIIAINSPTSITLSKKSNAANGATDTLTFTTQNRTLTLAGTNTGANTLAGILANSASGGKLSVTKTDAGTWVLTGTNTYTGSTNLNGGNLQFSSLSNLGASSAAINFAGGTLQYATSLGSPPDISSRTVTINAGGGGIDTNGNTVSFANPIGNKGVGGLTKAGAGTLTLNGADTYAGGTTVNGGTLKVGNAGALGFGSVLPVNQTVAGSSVNTNGSLDLNGQAIAEPITLNGGTLSNSGGAVTFSTGLKGVGFTAGGSGIPGSATVNFTGVTGAAATPVFGLTSASYTISNPGVYTAAPTVTISGGGGTGATATVNMASINNSAGTSGVLSFTITNAGSGYTSAPTFGLTGGTSSFAAVITGNANNFTLVGIQQTAAGSGYTGSSTASLSSGTGVVLSTPVAASVTLQSDSFIGGAGDITLPAALGGAGGFTKVGADKLTLPAVNNYGGNTIVSAGTLEVGPVGALPTTTSLTVGGSGTAAAIIDTRTAAGIQPVKLAAVSLQTGGTLTVASPASAGSVANHPNRMELITSALTAGGGTLDLGGNDLVVHGGSVTNVFNALKSGFNAGAGYWNGTGIASSSAASDPTFLTTLGEATGLTTFNGSSTLADGSTVLASDVLVKYTYYGDADLSGKVDGTDYTLIDSHGALTGWQHGDFNYDGSIDGSDYSLIDNAYNLQGSGGLAAPLSMVASNTSEIASAGAASSVPEPGTLGLFAIAAAGVLRTRRRRA